MNKDTCPICGSLGDVGLVDFYCTSSTCTNGSLARTSTRCKTRYKITRKQLLAWNPCCQDKGERYCDENLNVLFNGKESINWIDMLMMDSVPAEDKIWLATRPDALPSKIQEQFINIVVDRVVRKCCLNCGNESVKVWAVDWLDGTNRSYDAANIAYTTCIDYDFYTAYAIFAAFIIARSIHIDRTAIIAAISHAMIAATSYTTVYDERKLQVENLRRLITEREDVGAMK